MVKVIKKSKRRKSKFIQIRVTSNRKKLIDLTQNETGIDNYSKMFDLGLKALIKNAREQRKIKAKLEDMDLMGDVE